MFLAQFSDGIRRMNIIFVKPTTKRITDPMKCQMQKGLIWHLPMQPCLIPWGYTGDGIMLIGYEGL